MGYSPYSNDVCQFKIPQAAFSEQTVKYNVCLYFCLYGIVTYVYPGIFARLTRLTPNKLYFATCLTTLGLKTSLLLPSFLYDGSPSYSVA